MNARPEASLRMLPMKLRRFRRERALRGDVAWLAAWLNELGAAVGAQVDLAADHSLVARATGS